MEYSPTLKSNRPEPRRITKAGKDFANNLVFKDIEISSQN